MHLDARTIVKYLLYDWGDLNLWLFQSINGHRWHGFDSPMLLMGYLADFWGFPLYAAIWMVSVIVLKRRAAKGIARGAELQLKRFVIGFFIAVIAATLLKYALEFARPVTVLGEHAVHRLGHFDSQHSLPSGHATFAMLLAMSLWPLFGVLGRAALIVFVAWAGLARVWTGAHFPADVVAGYVVGAIAVAAAGWMLKTPISLDRTCFQRAARNSRS